MICSTNDVNQFAGSAAAFFFIRSLLSTSSFTNNSNFSTLILGMTTTCAMSLSHAS